MRLTLESVALLLFILITSINYGLSARFNVVGSQNEEQVPDLNAFLC